MKYPKGFPKGECIQVAVRFPNDFFPEIVAMAKKENKDFSDMVVYLARCGKLCLDESDQYEEVA